MSAPVTLPAAPLLAALTSAKARRGDLPWRHLLQHRAGWERALDRAKASGQVPIEVAEDLCEQVLGEHARCVYATAWDHAATRAANPADAGQPHLGPGAPSRYAYVKGCRCAACRAENAAYHADWRQTRRTRARARVHAARDNRGSAA